MVALRSSRARIPAPTPPGGWCAQPLPHDEADALVVPNPVLVQSATGWESAWLLACGPGSEGRRSVVQRDVAGSGEPEWPAEGPVALPAASPATPTAALATASARPPGPRRP